MSGMLRLVADGSSSHNKTTASSLDSERVCIALLARNDEGGGCERLTSKWQEEFSGEGGHARSADGESRQLIAAG
jgi:hypothetical protein